MAAAAAKKLPPVSAFHFGAPAKQVPLSKIVFDKYDTDHSGKINASEFKEMVYELGYHLSDVEFSLAIKILDTDGDGEISYPEFASWWQSEERFRKLQLTPERQAALIACSDFFQAFDEDGNGVLDKDEFAKCHASLVACGITNDTSDHCMATIDSDSDGTVSFNEYISWLVDTDKLAEAARALVAPLTASSGGAADDASAPSDADAAAASGPTETAPPDAVVATSPAAATPATAPAADADADAKKTAVAAFRAKSQQVALQARITADELRARRLARSQPSAAEPTSAST